MRIKKSFLVLALLIGIMPSHVFAQDDQYQNHKKKKVKQVQAQSTADAPPVTESPTKDEKSDKVDVTDLEQKYWAPKDVEFNVVQNRLYSKAKRFAVTVQAGPLLNDSFSSGPVYGFTSNYYFTERYGVELTYNKYQLQNSKVYDGFVNNNGVSPDFNRQNDYVGGAFNWVPFYGKMSLLDKNIVYFDMSFSPGFGIIRYDNMLEGGTNTTRSTPALSLDVAQHFFLSRSFALRLDMRNRYYTEQVEKFRTVGGFNKGDVIQTQNTLSTSIMFGVTYYFGSGG